MPNQVLISNSTKPIDLKSLILDNGQVNVYTDAAYVYLLLPMTTLAAVFNLISFDIFLKKSFNTLPLYKYLRIYSLASFMASFILIFCFFMAPYTFPQFILEYVTRVFRCKILPTYGTAFLFFYLNTLDIFINIHTAISFSAKFEKFKKISPYLISLTILFVCTFINGPLFFLYDIVKDTELPIVLRLCELSQFSESTMGKILLMVSFIIQGPIVLVLVIATNVIAMVSYKSYLKDKRKTQANAQIAQTSRDENISEKKTLKDEKNKKNFLFMTFYLGIFSAVNHLIQLTGPFVVFFSLEPSISSWLILTYFFSCALRNFVNIFFFYIYNKKFRKILLYRYLTEPVLPVRYIKSQNVITFN